MDPRFSLEFHVLGGDGEPYLGDEITLTSPKDATELCVLKRDDRGRGFVGIHHCFYHTLVIVRWGSGGYDGYELEEVST